MIVDLVQAGKKVGVTANSHKVIGNLLKKVAEAATKRGRSLRIGQKPAQGEDCTFAAAEGFDDYPPLRSALRQNALDVVGGTTWLWARPDFAESVDVLFIDEAGQMSLANALAASQGAISLVLLGDPQQLDQPVKGSHPPGAERSALAHLLGGKAKTRTPRIEAVVGIALEQGGRDFGRLTESRARDDQTGKGFDIPMMVGKPDRQIIEQFRMAGQFALCAKVADRGNGKTSVEEATAVAHLVGDLMRSGVEWTDEKGVTKPLRLEDVLIITPYNAQVRAIAEALPGAHVGTVDKFQGQEAPIAIYSMASSSADDAPRGMDFLYSLHRLNVATSRAQCLAIVVASPELLRARCRTPRQMQLANALCRFVERAEGEG